MRQQDGDTGEVPLAHNLLQTLDGDMGPFPPSHETRDSMGYIVFRICKHGDPPHEGEYT